MDGAVKHLQTILGGVSAGRATPQLLEGIRVECYGSHYPLNHVALATVHDRTITVQPFDREVAPAIERAIRDSALGLYPNRSKDVIRINVPPLSGERQEELIKYVSGVAEEQRVAVRNVRRETLKALDSVDLTEDELQTAKKGAEALTKRYIESIDETLAGKIHDLRGGDSRWVIKESKRR